ncbi:MAG: DNA polymerase III subunit beta [Chloroflexi bacterium]|nr:DNA polymerase III subunit beta [Chloroflexota bacterium]MCC6894027.1 DNA polymerase III subunit beta [Anaerolineae bacterium]
MKTSVLQDKLAKGLGIVARAVENRPTLPVLGNILVATEDARVKLAATNLEMSITTWIGAKVEQEGSITLPAKTLADLVNNLSPERVDLSLDPATLTVNVRCGATVSNVKGIDAAEFPVIPAGGDADITLPGKTLKDMINQTVFAAAKEDNRPILTGVLMQLDGNVMTMASADGYRLAVRTTDIEQTFAKRIDIVIPAKALSEVGRIIGDDDDVVTITLPKERDIVLFHMKHTDVATQLLEGKFPDFAAIIPRSYVTSSVMYTSDLLAACKRAEIFARDSAYSAKLLVKPAAGPGEPGAVTIVGMSAERGDNEGMLDASVEGEALNISFNIRYLIDVLNVINDERVVLESNGAANPGVIRPENRDDFVSVIMPMQVTR